MSPNPKLKRNLFRLLDALKSSPLRQASAVDYIGQCTGLKTRVLLREAAASGKAARGVAALNPADLALIASHFVYDGSGYFLRSDDGTTWGPRCRVDCLLDLEAVRGLSRRAGRDGGVSPAESALSLIQRTREVDIAIELGGLPAGLHVLNGNRVLVPRERRPLPGVAGDASPAVEFVQNLLGRGTDPEWEHQYALLLGWLKWWREALSGFGLHRPRQFIAFVGPSGCGKSKLQTDITKLVGGRQADAGLWLLGETAFNADMWCADHIVLSDATLNNRPGVRKSLRDKIKELVSNPLYPYHAKGKTLRTLPHLWGVSLSCNDDAASATIIPEIDASAAARFSYLKTYAPPAPFPSTGTPHGDSYWAAIDASLPAFAALVDAFEVPPAISEPRWGVAAWRHPAVMELIEQTHPDAELGTLLDDMLHGQAQSEVSQTAVDWWGELHVNREWAFRRMCPDAKALGQALRRLMDSTGWAGRIKSETRKFGPNRQPKNVWTLSKTADSHSHEA